MRVIQKQYIQVFLVVFISTLMFSCSKEEIINHEDLLVSGNPTPDYKGIPSVLIENYVNKIYIDLVGEKPSFDTHDSTVAFLKLNALSDQARETVIKEVIASAGYNDRLFQINADLLLNGMGYAEIDSLRSQYTYIKNLVYLQGDTFTGQYFEYEIEKLKQVLEAPDLFKDDQISFNEYLKRMSYNTIYDEVNMGSENFVISCFENLFKRYPTVDELKSGVEMVEGSSSILLRRSGRNKIEFLEIVTEDLEYYQGRVLDAYQTLLLRTPTSQELTETTSIYQTNADYRTVQITIAKLDEYAGFE